MQLGFSQQMKMSQQMKLAPRMIQSMEILQLPIMALKERLEKELSENPLLEEPVIETDPLDIPVGADAVPIDNDKPVEQRELVVDGANENAADFERLVEMSSDWPDDDSYSPRVSSNQISDSGDRQHDQIANLLGRPATLQDHLLEQFGFFTSTAAVREFAHFLIQNLDANGRLPGGLPEMLQVYGIPLSMEEAEQALAFIQRLDPPGVGARDLKECLLLQIGPDHPYRDVLVPLINDHLEDLAQNRMPVIQRKTGFPLEDIKAGIEELRALNPYPGRGFEVAASTHVIPDLFIDRTDDGQYVVRLEDEYAPRLRISRKWAQMLQNGSADVATREYIKKKVESAKWLIESIEQRNNTLKRVTQAIVDKQIEFLDKGAEHIVPLKMQQIADVVKVHVTTVSRAVDDKWVQTPRGIFPLKRFFGGGTTNAEGEEVAWDIIRIKLKEIVDKENKDDPLSDDALVDALSSQGYTLARRTVTKYRKAMNIPSSRQRKAY
jgi:RNA polymerase sigma-54 factor